MLGDQHNLQSKVDRETFEYGMLGVVEWLCIPAFIVLTRRDPWQQQAWVWMWSSEHRLGPQQHGFKVSSGPHSAL